MVGRGHQRDRAVLHHGTHIDDVLDRVAGTAFLLDRLGRHAEVDQEAAHVPRLALLGRPVMVVIAAADDDLGRHAALIQAGSLPQPVGRRCQRRVGIVGQLRPRDRPAQHDNCIVAAGLGRTSLGKSLPLERPDQHVGDRRRREHEQLNDSEDGNQPCSTAISQDRQHSGDDEARHQRSRRQRERSEEFQEDEGIHAADRMPAAILDDNAHGKEYP